MKTRSSAEPASPDFSLAETAGDSTQGYTHRGLTYPFGRAGPAPGEMARIADGVAWTRLPVPGSLGHINIWLLDDPDPVTGEDRVAIVDTGMADADSRAAWESLFAGPLAGRRVSRILVTHFHPDHVGLAGWLAERHGAPLWMSREEWLFARMLTADVRAEPPVEALAFWRAAGWSGERIAEEAAKGWGRFAAWVSPVPVAFVRMAEGDEIAIGARNWRVVIGSGHCPEHVCLVADGLLIAGDQVLPRITSNVSLSLSEPEGDPLGDWLASIDRLRALPGDLLVLPSHGEPFTGLHARLDALEAGHRGRLEALHRHLDEPRRAIDCFSTLFGRRIDDGLMGLATGEALAHLRRLEVEGLASRRITDGVAWYAACQSAAENAGSP